MSERRLTDWIPESYDESEHCSICGGEGLVEPLDAINAEYEDVGGGNMQPMPVPCLACGGSGDAADQTVW